MWYHDSHEEHLEGLKYLSLERCPQVDKSLTLLFQKYRYTLQHLDLSTNSTAPNHEALVRFASCGVGKQLKSLKITVDSSNQYDKKFLQVLPLFLCSCVALERLCLVGMPLVGAETQAALTSFSDLRRVEFTGLCIQEVRLTEPLIGLKNLQEIVLDGQSTGEDEHPVTNNFLQLLSADPHKQRNLRALVIDNTSFVDHEGYTSFARNMQHSEFARVVFDEAYNFNRSDFDEMMKIERLTHLTISSSEYLRRMHIKESLAQKRTKPVSVYFNYIYMDDEALGDNSHVYGQGNGVFVRGVDGNIEMIMTEHY